MDDRQLSWSYYNRGGVLGQASPPVPVGALSGTFTRDEQHKHAPTRISEIAERITQVALVQAAQHKELLTALAWCCGPVFAEQVTAVAIRRGMLVLQVRLATPAQLYQLRIRWEQDILEVVHQHLPAAGIRDVRFVSSP